MGEDHGSPKMLRPSRTFLGVEVPLLRRHWRHYRSNYFGEQELDRRWSVTAVNVDRDTLAHEIGKNADHDFFAIQLSQ